MEMNHKVKIDYCKVTATDGNKDLFVHKLRTIKDQIKEADREKSSGNLSYNFDFEESGDYIFGSVRVLRSDVPSKGKIHTNQTQPIDIKQDEAISEKTYFLYGIENQKLAVQYNHYGPRTKSLFFLVSELYDNNFLEGDEKAARSSYIPYMLGAEINLALSSNYITAIEVQTKTPVSDGAVPDNADFPDLIKSYDVPKATTKYVKLKNKDGNLVDVLRKLISRGKQVDIDNFDKFKVKGYFASHDRIEEIDLIKNRLQQEVSVSASDNSRELNAMNVKEVMIKNFKLMAKKYGW